MTKIGINGFGRIGRTSLRVWLQKHAEHAQVTLINTSGSMEIESWAHLLKYDSNYGTLADNIVTKRLQSSKDASDENPLLGYIYLAGQEIAITAQRNPALIPWGDYGVETVIDSTGVFTSSDKASAHLHSGVKRVIISAPPKDDGFAISVLGVKNYQDQDNLVSNASCTTNCVAPLIKILDQKIGIQKALLNTVHAYTDDQNLQDNSHKDLRRARAAGLNTIPTSTGAAKAVAAVYPDVSGKFDGLAIRVPVKTGSISDIVFLANRPTTIDEVNQILTEAAANPNYQGILAVTTEPLVSSDIVGRSESSIVDLALTNVVQGDLVRVVSWYDNEFGYCNRLVEQAVKSN